MVNLDFDIDNYLNPLIPTPWLYRLPKWVSWWFGYRAALPPRVQTVYVWFWTFVGCFCGVSVVQAVFEKCSYFVERNVPGIVGSFGATAVLLYGAIEAPFAQPRAILLGHTFAAVIGVGITKAFLHLSPDTFADDMWLAGSIACALATTFMSMTKTIHPPAGGTALLAASQVEIRALGWYYVPVVVLSAVLMMGVGLILNNIQRQWPSYWWTSVPLGPVLPKMEPEPKTQTSIDTVANGVGPAEVRRPGAIVLNVDGVFVPEFMELTYDQRAVLDELQTKIEEYYEIRSEKERRRSESLSRERSSRRSRDERRSIGDRIANAV